LPDVPPSLGELSSNVPSFSFVEDVSSSLSNSSLVSESIRLRLALTILLTAIRLVLLLVVFNRIKVVIMMRLLLSLVI
jgi:hypothetical protein